MLCPCGGSTTDHKVIRNKIVVGEYMKCTSCGRVSWINKPIESIYTQLRQ